MPSYRSRSVAEIARGIKAFLTLEAGITRGSPPNDTQAQEVERMRQKLQKTRSRLAAKEREVSEIKEKEKLVSLEEEQRGKRIKERYGRLQVPKRRLLDLSLRKYGVRSLADLGCSFIVSGGYSFYALDLLETERAILVDFNLPSDLLEGVESRKGASTVQGSFGDEAIAEEIGQVDAVILFDILLHQVSPNWDEILSLYAPRTRLFVVYNQQWTGSDKTVRLLDLGAEEYRKNVPQAPQKKNEGLYRTVLERPEEFDLSSERPNRDTLGLWQWAITDADLIDKMYSLGFILRYYEDNGHFQDLENFRNRGFVFEKLA